LAAPQKICNLAYFWTFSARGTGDSFAWQNGPCLFWFQGLQFCGRSSLVSASIHDTALTEFVEVGRLVFVSNTASKPEPDTA
jgi:hypothetical protein